MKSKILEKVINKVKVNNNISSQLYELINLVKQSNMYDVFDKVMSDVDESLFVDDEVHGINHNERVALLTFLLGVKQGVSEQEMKILIKAALYHDIGRKEKSANNHGEESARIIDLKSYELAKGFTRDELRLLKFLCEAHSNSDSEYQDIAKKYMVRSSQTAKRLMDILKDADALDRVRLKRFGKLNPYLLRLDVSKSLVSTATELYRSYTHEAEKKLINFDSGVFDLGNSNTIEDENFIYVFRALSKDNEVDLENPDIDVLRTKSAIDIERGGDPLYTADDEISLAEVYSNIRVARSGKNNNCTSFSSNSNVTLDYADKKYIMYAVPKSGDSSMYVAGKYMLEEISKKISRRMYSAEVEEDVKKMLEQINQCTSVDEIKNILEQNYEKINPTSYKEGKKFYGEKIQDISLDSTHARLATKKSLSEVQNLEYCKVIAGLTVLESRGMMKSIVPTQNTNTNLLGVLGLAFSSSELIHYGDIKKQNITELSRAAVELFSLIQQLQEQKNIDIDVIETLKNEVLECVKTGKTIEVDTAKIEGFSNLTLEQADEFLRFDSTKISENELTSEDKTDSERTGESNGNTQYSVIPFEKGNEAIRYIRNYANAKVRAYDLIRSITEMIPDDAKRQQIEQNFDEVMSKIVVPLPSIIARRNNGGVKLAESVRLDMNKNKDIEIFNIDEQERLIAHLNSLSYQELVEISKGDLELVKNKELLARNINPKVYENGFKEYIIDYIVSKYDFDRAYAGSKVKVSKKNKLKAKLRDDLSKIDIEKLYNAVINAGINMDDMPNYVVNMVIEDGFGIYDSIEKLIESDNLGDYLQENVQNMRYQVPPAVIDNYALRDEKSEYTLKLRSYQEFAVDGIDRIYENRRFAGVVLPTGAGKSFVAMEEMLRHKNESIVYFAPQDEILHQFQKHVLKKLLNKEELTIDDVYVMEKMDFGEIASFLESKVYNRGIDVYELLKNLKNPEFPEDKKAQLRAKFLPRKTSAYDDVVDEIKTVFPGLKMYCYQSLGGQEFQDLVKNNKKTDLFVFDELHRTGAETWKESIKTLLETEKNASAKILGITATPLRDDNERTDMMKFMAEKYGGFTQEEIENKEYLAEEMYLIDAIQRGYVVEPKIVSFAMTLKYTEEYKLICDQLKEEREINPNSDVVKMLQTCKDEMDKIIGNKKSVVNNSMEEVADVIQENIPVKLRNGRFIVFLPQKPTDYQGATEEYVNEQIENINNALMKINPDISSGYLLSNRADKKQNLVDLQNFEESVEEDLKLLYAINMLNEGVHVNNINGEIMLRPIGAGRNILYFQQIGRVIFSIEEGEVIPEEDRPIIFDVYNNYIARDLNRVANQTTPISDLNSIQIIKNWIIKNERFPDTNSENIAEARDAITLKKIQQKYEIYLDGINDPNLSKEEIREIEKILEIGKSIDLFDLDIPDRIIPPGEKEIGRVNMFEVKGEVKDFMTVFKETQKAVKKIRSNDTVSSKHKEVLELRKALSVLQTLSQYGFSCTDERLMEFYMETLEDSKKKLSGNPDANNEKISSDIQQNLSEALKNITLKDLIEKAFSKRTASRIIEELEMDDEELSEYMIGQEFDFVRECFTSNEIHIKRELSMYDIQDLRRSGIFMKNGHLIDGIDLKGFVEKGPSVFKSINIYTGTNYGPDGYNIDGYNEMGYDRNGYDRDGYDSLRFKRGEKTNIHGFYRPLYSKNIPKEERHEFLHIDTGTELNPEYFDIYGNYWAVDPSDSSKRINSYRKVNEQNINIDGLLCVENEYGEFVPVFNKRYFDEDGFYWEANPDFPNDVTKRRKTDRKFNEDFFDVNGFFYDESPDGKRNKTSRKTDNYGFDMDHLYHKLLKKRRKVEPSGPRDDEGYDYKGINTRNFNRDHLYVNENGETSFLNPDGVAYDGYMYELNEEAGEYIKGDKWYDSEGYDIEGLNEDLFDRAGFYNHTNEKTNPHRFNCRRKFVNAFGLLLDFDIHEFDFFGNFKGIEGRKYNDKFFDWDGYYYEEDKETGERVKTDRKYNDEYFDWDGYYYEEDKKTGERVNSYKRYNPHGINMQGEFDIFQVTDEEYLETMIKKNEQALNDFMQTITKLTEEVNSNYDMLLKKCEQSATLLKKNERSDVSNDRRKITEKLESFYRRLQWDFEYTIRRVTPEYIMKENNKNITELSESVSEFKKKISKYMDLIDERKEHAALLYKIRKAKEELMQKHMEKFDIHGICKSTGLKYDERFFMKDGSCILTGNAFDLRGFDLNGKCTNNNGLPYDEGGFLADGTHKDTGELYHNGYNAYGLDVEGRNRQGKRPLEINRAVSYIQALFNTEDKDAFQKFINSYILKLKQKRIITTKQAMQAIKKDLVIASLKYPKLKEDIITKTQEIMESIKINQTILQSLDKSSKMYAKRAEIHEEIISNLNKKLEALNLDLGSRA